MDEYLRDHLVIWLGGLGRVVDALVWLASFGLVKTQLHFKVTQIGDPDWGRRPWIKVVKNTSSVVSGVGGNKAVLQRQPHWLNFVQAAVLLGDGLIQFLCFGFVVSDFSVKLTFSDWWKAQTRTPLFAAPVAAAAKLRPRR